MKIFDNQDNDKMIEMLRQSRQNFRFDQEANKLQIFQHLDQSGAPLYSSAPAHIHVFRYSVMAVSLLLVVSGTFVYASTSSKPGDKLFSLNKFSDQVILSLPFSPETKAALHTSIVKERLSDLDQVELQVQASQLDAETRGLATVRESDDSISNAIAAVTANRNALQAAGQTQAAAQLSVTLNHLQDLAAQHEQKIQILENETSDTQIKQSIQNHLDHIHRARQKSMMEQDQSPEQN